MLNNSTLWSNMSITLRSLENKLPLQVKTLVSVHEYQIQVVSRLWHGVCKVYLTV